jgi:hypothetical protein
MRLTYLILVLALTACGSLLEADNRRIDEARVTVTGTTPVPMKLIVSSLFDASRNPATGEVFVNFLESDTLTVVPPFEQKITFTAPSDRFVARLMNADSTSTADIEMRVYIDGKEDFRQKATMKNSSLQYTFYNFF